LRWQPIDLGGKTCLNVVEFQGVELAWMKQVVCGIVRHGGGLSCKHQHTFGDQVEIAGFDVGHDVATVMRALLLGEPVKARRFCVQVLTQAADN
jgi:hypothetical protein